MTRLGRRRIGRRLLGNRRRLLGRRRSLHGRRHRLGVGGVGGLGLGRRLHCRGDLGRLRRRGSFRRVVRHQADRRRLQQRVVIRRRGDLLLHVRRRLNRGDGGLQRTLARLMGPAPRRAGAALGVQAAAGLR
jgi:hypothetical protein